MLDSEKVSVNVEVDRVEGLLDDYFQKHKQEFSNLLNAAADGKLSIPLRQTIRAKKLAKFRNGKVKRSSYESLFGREILYAPLFAELLVQEVKEKHPDQIVLSIDDLSLDESEGFQASAAVQTTLQPVKKDGVEPLKEIEVRVKSREEIVQEVEKNHRETCSVSYRQREKTGPVEMNDGVDCVIEAKTADGEPFPAADYSGPFYTGEIPISYPLKIFADTLLIGRSAGDLVVRTVLWPETMQVINIWLTIKRVMALVILSEEELAVEHGLTLQGWLDLQISEETDRELRSRKTVVVSEVVQHINDSYDAGEFPAKWIEARTADEYQKQLKESGGDEKVLLSKLGALSPGEAVAKLEEEVRKAAVSGIKVAAFMEAAGLDMSRDREDVLFEWATPLIKEMSSEEYFAKQAAEAKARAEEAKAKVMETVGQEVPVVEPQALLEQQQEAAPG